MTYCTIEANYRQTRSIARPLRDSRAVCFSSPAQSHPRCTKCNSQPINDRRTNFILGSSMWHYNYLRSLKG